MRKMTSCVVNDGVMTSSVVDLISTDRLGRLSCVMSVVWYLQECRLHTVLMRTMTSCVSGASASDGRKAVNWRSDVLHFLYSWVHLQRPHRLGSPPTYEGGQWGPFEWMLFGDSILIGPYGWKTQLERFMQSRLCVQRMITWWLRVPWRWWLSVCWSAVIRSMSHVCWMMSLD